MLGVSEIIGIGSIVSSFPLAYRSVLEIVSSLQRGKRVCISTIENESDKGGSKLFQTDYLVAGSLATARSKLALLAQSELPRVRARVAENANCPANVLSRLAQDLDAEVRLSVAYNPKVPLILLESLVEDECPDVLYALAEDHNLATSLLNKLSQNDNPYVAQRAKQTLRRLEPADTVCWLDHRESSERAPSRVLCAQR